MRYLILLGVIAILAACASTGEEQEIVVKKRIETGLKIYKLAYRHAQNDRLADQKQNLWDHWASFVNSEIGDTLARRYGIRSYPSQENATDLIVEAKVRPGRGLPRFGRHFDLITEYIDFINIRFIDAKTGKTIGEVEYHRPSLADNPPYLIRTMIDRLVQGTEKPKGG
jgi:hypothetical protein